MACGWMLGSHPTWSKHMCAASLSAAVAVGGKVKVMKCLGSNRAWLKQRPCSDKRPTSGSSVRKTKRVEGADFMNPRFPPTRLHQHRYAFTAANQLMKSVISYLGWQPLMCTGVKHFFKWWMSEAITRLSFWMVPPEICIYSQKRFIGTGRALEFKPCMASIWIQNQNDRSDCWLCWHAFQCSSNWIRISNTILIWHWDAGYIGVPIKGA